MGIGKQPMSTLVVVLLVMCHGLLGSMAVTGDQQEDWPSRPGKERGEEVVELAGSKEEQWGAWGGDDRFLLRDAKPVVKTDAGEMRVVKSLGGERNLERHLHIGFITMEPQTLFIPQYLDSSLIIFIRRGIP